MLAAAASAIARAFFGSRGVRCGGASSGSAHAAAASAGSAHAASASAAASITACAARRASSSTPSRRERRPPSGTDAGAAAAPATDVLLRLRAAVARLASGPASLWSGAVRQRLDGQLRGLSARGGAPLVTLAAKRPSAAFLVLCHCAAAGWGVARVADQRVQAPGAALARRA